MAALEKIRTDYAESPVLSQVDTQILNTLLLTPERTTEINAVLDRLVTPRTPAASQPETRFSTTANAVSPLIEKKVLLDRVETLLTESITAWREVFRRSVGDLREANRLKSVERRLEAASRP